MGSEDICLSVFLCICVDEGMGDKTSYLYPAELVDEGMGDKIRSIIPTGLRRRGYGR